MRQEYIVPVAATATFPSRFIVLTDKDGNVLLVGMPSPGGAQFYATGLQIEFTRAKRAKRN
jgi:hypothetical protein